MANESIRPGNQANIPTERLPVQYAAINVIFDGTRDEIQAWADAIAREFSYPSVQLADGQFGVQLPLTDDTPNRAETMTKVRSVLGELGKKEGKDFTFEQKPII